MTDKIKSLLYFMLKYFIIFCVKVRWAWFHINPMYIKFYMTNDECHFQHRTTGVLFSNYVWAD